MLLEFCCLLPLHIDRRQVLFIILNHRVMRNSQNVLDKRPGAHAVAFVGGGLGDESLEDEEDGMAVIARQRRCW
jgi:hypothetical protein